MTSYVVTSAPPNPNGDLHLGHLSGPFLGADVLTRHLRQRGHDVRYVGYSDEHSCYVPRRAAEIGSTAYPTAKLFGDRMEETLSLGAMHHDWFTRPLTDATHTEFVQRFFLELWESGALEVQELPVFHCAPCDRYLYEAEVRGECQFCAEPSDGVYCEACGLPQDPAGLAAPRCTACWNAPETKTMRRIVFPLERYRERLEAYYADAQAKAEWRPRLISYLDGLFERALPDTAISREADYGIPVPLPGWEGHILDTWFSGIWGYVAGTARVAEANGDRSEWERLWTGPETRIVNFIGFDCSFSHAVLWPALLLAQGELTLPAQVVINEFYRLEGDKFSTSRGHAIWGGEFLRRVNADALRFHLCLTGPERAQNNFSMKEFADTLSTVLAGGLERWTDTVLDLLGQDFDSVVPAAGPADGPLAAERAALPQRIADALGAEGFSPQRAADTLATVIERADADLRELALLRVAGPREEYAGRLAAHVELLAAVTVTAAPLMPGWSAFLAGHLGLPVDLGTRMPVWAGVEGRLLAEGTTLPTATPLFFHELS
ncbi:class I tRNA ligase family protein [Streptomyces sp. NBC_01443]|uniref:methionine--tRNA ligase n=1 Tax=Streptomyces sp. NBC_01443 TaxID=2903868 RepID=UPI00224F836B|nr:class I tRNA ligase family protein [Streptomyces sp. NBC_01443]MCX4629025.1 class I tRNA ligase family protein [Streptomyces sp. NBC_01443]